jgi:hypothetical protein
MNDRRDSYRYRGFLVTAAIIVSAIVSACDSPRHTVTTRTVEGFRPSILSGESQFLEVTETRRIRYSVSAAVDGTAPAPGTVKTLATCVEGFDIVWWPGYSYSLNMSVNITGEVAPAAADIRERAQSATPSPSAEFIVPEDAVLTIKAAGHYKKYRGTVFTSIEEFTNGAWEYVPGSVGMWDITFQLLWMDFEVIDCHDQGII